MSDDLDKMWTDSLDDADFLPESRNRLLLARLEMGMEGRLRRENFWYEKNMGLYNGRDGSKLWYGDIDARDFPKMQNRLKDDEVIFLLDEDASYWNFTQVDESLAHHIDKDSEKLPSINYVIYNARYSITNKHINYVAPLHEVRVRHDLLGEKTLFQLELTGWINYFLEQGKIKPEQISSPSIVSDMARLLNESLRSVTYDELQLMNTIKINSILPSQLVQIHSDLMS